MWIGATARQLVVLIIVGGVQSAGRIEALVRLDVQQEGSCIASGILLISRYQLINAYSTSSSQSLHFFCPPLSQTQITVYGVNRVSEKAPSHPFIQPNPFCYLLFTLSYLANNPSSCDFGTTFYFLPYRWSTFRLRRDGMRSIP